MKIKLLLLLLLPIIGFTQTPSIEVYNLHAIPNVDDSITDTTYVRDTTITLQVAFKIDGISSADSIYFNAGTTLGGGNTQSLAYKVGYSNGEYYLTNSASSHQLYGKNVYLQFEFLRDDFSDYAFIEVWGKDNAGVITPKNQFQN